MELNLIMPLPPSVNEYLGYRVVKFGGKNIPQPYEKKVAKTYKEINTRRIKEQIVKQNWTTPDKGKYVKIHLVFYMDRKRKDQDNMGKVMFDTLVKAGVVHDDDIIMSIVEDIFIDKFNPRIELRIVPTSKIGIFKDLGRLDAFMIKNCKGCTRLLRNCSLLNKSTDNYITQEIDKELLTCSARKPKKD